MREADDEVDALVDAVLLSVDDVVSARAYTATKTRSLFMVLLAGCSSTTVISSLLVCVSAESQLGWGVT